MAELKLGGRVLDISPERDSFISFRKAYRELGEEHRGRFINDFSAIGSADQLFERLPILVESVLQETAKTAATDLAHHRIYDIPVRAIHAELQERAEDLSDRIRTIQDRYFEIIGKSAELEALRRQNRDNRGRIIGGGFGIEGAAQGIAVATAANIAIDLSYGLLNLTSKAASSLGDKEKKRLLLADASVKFDIGQFLAATALCGAEYVAQVINNKSEKPIFDIVSKIDHEKSEAILESVTDGRVPEWEIAEILIQALKLDPFNLLAWSSWLNRFGDSDGSLAASAAAVGVGSVELEKVRMFAERRASLSWQSPEDCETNMGVLEEYADWLGIPFADVRAVIEKRSIDLDKRRRTFNGTEYSSIVDATEARRAYEDEQRRTVSGIVHDSQDSADQARIGLRSQEISASSSDSLIGWLALPYRRFKETTGRSCRKEFYVFFGFILSVTIGCMVLFSGLSNPDAPGSSPISTLVMVFWLLFITGSLVVAATLQVRRFHDQDRTGWLVLLNLIPYVGWMIALAFMFVEGTPHDNRYGPNPNEV